MERGSHQHQDTVIADMLHSRVQADGWMDGEDDDDGDDDDSDNDGEEMTGFSHNYDDGNDLDLMMLMSQRRSASRGEPKEGGNSVMRSSQHWETEVRPFSSGRSSVNSARVGNSSARIAASATGSGREKPKTHPRPDSARPLSSVSRASGRESRAIGE